MMQMDKREIINRYRAAKDRNEQIRILAELNDCPVTDILQILTEAGEISGVKPNKAIPARPNGKNNYHKWTADEEKQLIKLVEQGYTNMQIAEKMGLDNVCVTKKKHKLKGAGMIFDAATKQQLTQAATQAEETPDITPQKDSADSGVVALLSGLAEMAAKAVLGVEVDLVDGNGCRWKLLLSRED